MARGLLFASSMPMADPVLSLLSAPLPDPSVGEFLELRLTAVRIAMSDSPVHLERAREALRALGHDADQTIRKTDVHRPDDLFETVCFAARTHIADARELLSSPRAVREDLVRARRRFYRGLSLVAEALAATSGSRMDRRASQPPGRRGVLFAAFVTQVVAATRANPKDIAWVLEVAEAEINIAVAHPDFARVSAEQRATLRGLRGEIAAWAAGPQNADFGLALLNRLILLIDCLNH
jgi:hypothetical protein